MRGLAALPLLILLAGVSGAVGAAWMVVTLLLIRWAMYVEMPYLWRTAVASLFNLVAIAVLLWLAAQGARALAGRVHGRHSSGHRSA